MQKRRFKVGKIAAFAIAGALAAHPTAAMSDEVPHFSLGVFLDFTIGRDWNVGLGLDARMSFIVDEGPKVSGCSAIRSRSGVGGYAQAVGLFRGGLRVSAGVHGGHHPERGRTSFDIETGWVWQDKVLNRAGGHGLQVGLLVTPGPADIGVRFALFDDGKGWANEGRFILGGRFGGVFTSEGFVDSNCQAVRPL